MRQPRDVMPKRSPLALLRHVALAEGVSFLLLLFVAMPLKYFAGMPMAVKAAGWLHGALFLLLCALLVYVLLVTTLSFLRALIVFAAALVPFGPFLIDRWMKRWETELAS